jgi:hypothetical protein
MRIEQFQIFVREIELKDIFFRGMRRKVGNHGHGSLAETTIQLRSKLASKYRIDDCVSAEEECAHNKTEKQHHSEPKRAALHLTLR